MPNLEPVEIAGFDLPEPDAVNPGCRRSVAQSSDHPLDGRFVAFDMHIDAAIGAVTHPAGDLELVSLLLRPGAKEDALNASGDGSMARNASHHTVVMSGASSAFIPTTL